MSAIDMQPDDHPVLKQIILICWSVRVNNFHRGVLLAVPVYFPAVQKRPFKQASIGFLLEKHAGLQFRTDIAILACQIEARQQ
jgi:hypothetical protein